MSREKNLEKSREKNTEAVAPIIPWASASSAVAEPAVESAAEVPEASATAKETVEETAKGTTAEPTQPARLSFFDRIRGDRKSVV